MGKEAQPARPLTVAEAARELGVTPRRVRQLITGGQLRAEAVSPRLYLIRPADLDRVRDRPRPGPRPRRSD